MKKVSLSEVKYKKKMLNFEYKSHDTITIGIVTEPSSYKKSPCSSFIDIDLISWIGDNINVIPIPFDIQTEYLVFLMNQINGIILPGGGLENKKWHNKEQLSKYLKTLKDIVDFSEYTSKNGNSLPVLGICQGFEQLLINILNIDKQEKEKEIRDQKILDKTPAEGVYPIFLTKSGEKLFKKYSLKYPNRYELNPSGIFHKNLGFIYDSLTYMKVEKKINPVLLSLDDNNNYNLAMIEYKGSDILGVGFHPEKIYKKNILKGKIPKSVIDLSRDIRFIFLSKCKKNKNRWKSFLPIKDFLIENYDLYKLNKSEFYDYKFVIN